MRALLACWIVALCLSCGGKGQPSPQGSIRIDAPASAVTAGDADVVLRASGQGELSWTLQGPGALSQQSGVETRYSPPTCVVRPVHAVITVSSASASASTDITVAPAASQHLECLEIETSSSEVTIGLDGPVQLKALGSGDVSRVAWSVFGPGSVSAASGPASTYVPPERWDTATSITITAELNGLRAHAGIVIRPRVSYSVGGHPQGMAFDGENLWVAVGGSAGSKIVKLRPADGAVLAAFDVGIAPWALAWDGSALWAGGHGGLVQVRPADGAILSRNAAGEDVWSVLVAGDQLWANTIDDGIDRYRISDGAPLSRIQAETFSLAFDGAVVWALNHTTNQDVSRFRGQDGAPLGNVWTGGNVWSLAAGPGVIWVAKAPGSIDGKVTLVKVDAAQGVVLDAAEVFVGWAPDLLVDGNFVWAAGPDAVYRIDATDLSRVTRYAVTAPTALASDGQHVWASSASAGVVYRLP